MAAPRISRREKTLRTRRRILRAAYEAFCEDGYAGTTMGAIARRAEVAVQTLYFTFNTKGALLSETLGACIAGFEAWDPRMEREVARDHRAAFVHFHAWFPAFEAAASQVDALAVFVDASLDIFARVGSLAAVMQAAAAADPDVALAVEVGERRRVEGYGMIVEGIAARGPLRRGVTPARANDILLTVASIETHQHLVAGRGWSRTEVRAWLIDVLGHQLLPAVEQRKQRPRRRSPR